MHTAFQTRLGPQQYPSSARSHCVPDATQAGGGRILCALMVLAALVVGAPTAGAEEGATLAALEIAYAREMNAHAHRLAYAAAAEREGHCEAADLFRASATAESIHAMRIAAAIEQFGARPSWTLGSVAVRSTADNLRTCLEREIDEHDRIYARFARLAREECLYEACAVLQDVRAAGHTQAALFDAALERLNRRQKPAMIVMAGTQAVGVIPAEDCAATYTLCPGDGSLFTDPIGKRCPNCRTHRSSAIALAWRESPLAAR